MSSLTADSARQNNADPNSNVELPEMEGALVLAVAPCVAALAWLGDDISFLSFYSK